MGDEDDDDYGDEGFKREQEAEYDFMWGQILPYSLSSEWLNKLIKRDKCFLMIKDVKILPIN